MLARTTITNTIAVVIMVSLRVGQVTFAAFGAHLLDEFDRIRLRHVAFRSLFARVSSAVPPAERREASFP